MKKIKAIILVLAMALAAVLCGSCKKHGFADDLVQYLNERDEEEIVNLFCEKTRTSSDIDLEQQISDVFDLFGDRTIASYYWRGGGAETHWEKGKKTWHRMGIIIEEIELSDGSNEIEYIAFSRTLVDEENPELVGLEWFYAFCDEKEYWVGELVE